MTTAQNPIAVNPVTGALTYPAGVGGSAALLDRGAWVTSTAYAVGDVVTQSGQRYACGTAHTSGTFATDLAATKWVALDNSAGLAAANNLSDLASASTSRTNLGVAYGTSSGTVTEGNDTRVTGAAQKSSNLSDLASASTARTNLGLGTAATSAATAFATPPGSNLYLAANYR